jgi:hypothetical protein
MNGKSCAACNVGMSGHSAPKGHQSAARTASLSGGERRHQPRINDRAPPHNRSPGSYGLDGKCPFFSRHLNRGVITTEQAVIRHAYPPSFFCSSAPSSANANGPAIPHDS